jgi:hypothetical protein
MQSSRVVDAADRDAVSDSARPRSAGVAERTGRQHSTGADADRTGRTGTEPSSPVLRFQQHRGNQTVQDAVQRRRDGDGGVDAPDIKRAARIGTDTPSRQLPHLDTIQRSFGRYDVSGVQAHLNATANESARAINAEAYTTDDHVAFADRQPSRRTVAHEAAHVVQQRAGARPSGGVGSEGDKYERHAERVADAVERRRSAEPVLDRMAGAGDGNGASRSQGRPDTVQRKVGFEFQTNYEVYRFAADLAEQIEQLDTVTEQQRTALREQRQPEQIRTVLRGSRSRLMQRGRTHSLLQKYHKNQCITSHTKQADGFQVEADSHEVEFVTRPFAENDAGRTELKEVMESTIVQIAATLKGKTADATTPDGAQVFLLKDAMNEASSSQTVIVKPGAPLMAGPQVTGAPDLRNLRDFRTQIDSRAVQSPYDLARTKRAAGMSVAQPQMYRNPAPPFPETWQTDVQPNTRFDGLLLLIWEYLSEGSTPQARGEAGKQPGPIRYLKNIANPFLSRTDFHTIYNLVDEGLPRNKSEYKQNPDLFVDDVLAASGLENLREQNMVTRTLWTRASAGNPFGDQPPTVAEWLKSIVNPTRGTRLFPTEELTAADTGLSLGALGTMTGGPTGNPQQTRGKHRPVLEYRGVGPSSLPLSLWTDWALEMFDLFRRYGAHSVGSNE